jgi:[acyl-carrier-protein] S-malonyltransferase
MAPAAARLREALEQISVVNPRYPVVHNVDGKIRNDSESIKAALVAQADHPVCWVDCVRTIAQAGATRVFECGPGKVLTPLCKRIDADTEGFALCDRPALDQGLLLTGKSS